MQKLRFITISTLKNGLLKCAYTFKRRLKSALNHLHTKDLILREKLKKIFFLHTNLDGYYHLLFRAIFEIEKLYPAAYQVVVQYRHWLTTEVYKLLLTVKKDTEKR